MPRSDLVVAPGKQGLPRSRELLHPPTWSLRCVDVSLAIEGQAVGATNHFFRPRVPAELPRLLAVTAPLRQELPLHAELLHAMVAGVGHIEGAVWGESDVARVPQF